MSAYGKATKMGQGDGRKGNEKKYRTRSRGNGTIARRVFTAKTSCHRRIGHSAKLNPVIGFCAKFDHPGIILK